MGSDFVRGVFLHQEVETVFEKENPKMPDSSEQMTRTTQTTLNPLSSDSEANVQTTLNKKHEVTISKPGLFIQGYCSRKNKK